jgi:DNA-binding PadR family transcriptional regulator
MVETDVSFLEQKGFVISRRLGRGKIFRLSDRGRAAARDFWWSSDAAVRSYVAALLIWVRGAALIEEDIQPKYPDMYSSMVAVPPRKPV